MLIAALGAIICMSGAMFTTMTASAYTNAVNPAIDITDSGACISSEYVTLSPKFYTSPIKVKPDEEGAEEVTVESVWADDNYKGITFCCYTLDVNSKAGGSSEKVTSYCGIAITGIDSSVLDIDLSSISTTVPSYVLSQIPAGYPQPSNRVTAIGPGAFSNSNLKTINLTGVKYIANGAFQKAMLIESIEIPESVDVIDDNCFANSGLKLLKVNAALNGIPNNFCANTKLTKFEMPNYQNIRYIGDSAFKGTSITDIPFDSWENDKTAMTIAIGKSAFEKCTNIKKVILPDNVNIIYTNAFAGCTAIESFKAGAYLWGIDQKAFSGCTSLKTIELNDRLDSIGGAAFEKCTALKTINGLPDSLHDWNPDRDNPLAGTGFGNNVFNGCTGITSFTLPASLTKVPEGLMANCTSLVSVTGKSSLTAVDKNAFLGCTSLLEVQFANVDTVEDSAFQGCAKLATIDMPKLTTVGKSAFKGCSSITKLPSIIISDIKDNAFENCTSLSAVESGVISAVGNNAFKGSGIKTLNLTADTYGENCFSNCTALTEATIDFDKFPETAKGMFSGCTALTTVNGSLGITIISDNTFNGCTALENFEGNNVRIIKNSAFKGCSSLKTFGAKKNDAGYWVLHDIGQSAFEGCSSMTDYLYLESPTIQQNAFNKSGIVHVEVVSPVEAAVIGNSAFANCGNLKSVIINCNPDNLSFGASVFSACPSLESVKYSSVTIPESTFTKDTALTAFTLINMDAINKNGGITLEKNAFNGCTALQEINTDNGSDFAFNAIAEAAFKDSGITKTYANKNTTFSGVNQYYNSGVVEALELSTLTNNMFTNCTSLQKASTSKKLTVIPNGVFSGCRTLESFDNGSEGSGFAGIVTINASAFENTAIKEVILDDTNSVGDKAFYGSSVRKLEVTGSIGNNSFSNCNSLMDVTINSDVIGSAAFYSCGALSNVAWNKTPTKIGNNAFEKCDVLVDLYIPGTPTLGSNIVTAKTENLIMYGDKGTDVVKAYAEKNNIQYMDYDPAIMADRMKEKNKPGDVDGNGLITVRDVVKMQRWLLKKNDTALVGKNMDLNGDGVCNVYDLILLKKKVVSGE